MILSMYQQNLVCSVKVHSLSQQVAMVNRQLYNSKNIINV